MTASLVLQVALGGLLMGLVYALVAAGLSLIFGLMDVVNFAHGELLMLAMYATFFISAGLGLDPLLQLPLVAALLFLVGVAIYRLLIARALAVRFNSGMVQIFVTFGLSIFLVGAAQTAFGSDFRSVTTGILANRIVQFGGIVLPLPQLAAGIVCLLA
ncbi:MAG: branched-chain amino acid ABC transporter permease, partial [Acetobacteraceae bacterium]|nr:branched-chain amino acid ABC transporter permease [Acetobacteraceae bacterium]